MEIDHGINEHTTQILRHEKRQRQGKRRRIRKR